MQEAKDKVILNAQGKPYRIQTEDGLPANAAAAALDEERVIRAWHEIEQAALNQRERELAEERTRICIWCGKVCESVAALAEHEDECG
jgi:predicted dinucleotide-binding enzyme